MRQTGIAEQGASQVAHAEQIGTVQFGKPEKILQHLYQAVNLIAPPCPSGDIHIREVLGYLGSVDIDLARDLRGRHIGLPLLFHQLCV